jgi:hypothetical protein
MKKNISIKIYAPTGEFLKEWFNFQFVGFSKAINAGVGECRIVLLEKFDYSGIELLGGNLATITISDTDTTTTDGGPRVIYSGYVSQYAPTINDNGIELIYVTLLGHYTKLIDILKSGANTNLYTDSTDRNGLKTASGAAATEIAYVMNAIITRYQAETTTPQIFALSIPETGQDLNYIFKQKTYREALDIALSACPDGYFWYVNELGGFTLKQKSSTSKHIFMLGKHFNNITVTNNIENIYNVVLIWNGLTGGSAIYKSYSDAVSIAQYGRRPYRITDKGIQDSDTADNIAAKFLAEHKDPDIQVSCTIIDNNIDAINGYDIESIEPGETCRFIGFNEAGSYLLRDAMLITRVDYSLESVTLTIENFKTDIVSQAQRLQDQVGSIESDTIPDSYT